MPEPTNAFGARLFYSYCHHDASYRQSMETALELLEQDGLIHSWHDERILPGQSISKEVRLQMDDADILVFLLSKDFIASSECRKEWLYAKNIASSNKPVLRIPIILKHCAWKDLLGDDDVKALPKDAKPVVSFRPQDAAWTDVYNGIKGAVTHLQQTFTAKPRFLQEMEETDFLSQQRIKLQDIFIFLTLSRYPAETAGNRVLEETVTTPDELMNTRYNLIHGDEASGKTALARYLFLRQVDKSEPVLFVDLKKLPVRNWDRFLREAYREQFRGDYALWRQLKDKTILLDNLTPDARGIDFIPFVINGGAFHRVIVTVSSDIYNSYFKDESRLAEFCELRLRPLTHRQQEELIRTRLALLDTTEPITDGFVDSVEDHINSIVTSQNVVPRYPFFVLSILQSYEAFMPTDMSITSYGYCYQALIVATLVKAGISNRDSDLEACFNFASHLAFAIHQEAPSASGDQPFDIATFTGDYREKYVIADAVVNRLKDDNYGVITQDGQFRTRYIYYFFLGRYLARNCNKTEIAELLDRMCDESYYSANYLTLLFTLHHTDDKQIVDNILVRTMCTIDDIPVAALNSLETRKFGDILGSLRDEILSTEPVDAERGKERDGRDEAQDIEPDDDGRRGGTSDPANDLYRILKNNEIMGQILRNKQGSLEKREIVQIIETVADGGLRLVNSFLRDDKEIVDVAQYIKRKFPKHNVERIKKELRLFAFIWTMMNVEKIVQAINVPELQEVIQEVVRRRGTPAFDLIGYFTQLDDAQELTAKEKGVLDGLWKKHRDAFIKRVLSIRTQGYMNTHKSDVRVEQSVCARLNITYRTRGVRK